MPRTQVGIYLYTIRVKQFPVCCPRRSGNVMFNDALSTTLGIEGEGGTFSTSGYSHTGTVNYAFSGNPRLLRD